jgi:leucyl-tRNA synthetase
LILPYDFAAIERKWQERWREAGCFAARPGNPRAKFFNFNGGPFPDGPLHMEHVRSFTLGDVMARFQRMQGRSVLSCLEFDAFGLPNELAAREQGISPETLTRANIERLCREMAGLGLSFDWSHVHTTCDPRYYQWTQWLFLRLFERDLVYRAPAYLNWCSRCETTLAHMQVVEGRCWRCEGAVEQRALTQWFVRLNAYSEILLATLAELDGWSEGSRRLLRGFIGPTPGVEVDFEVEGPGPGLLLTAFVPDEGALAAVAYVAVAPLHPVLVELMAGHPGQRAVERFHEALTREPRRKQHRRAAAEVAEEDLSGLDTGVRVRHPVSGARLPVFIARYADLHFATGIEVGSPAVRERDARFARLHAIAAPPADPGARTRWAGRRRPATHYRVRDWLVSRQRSWGTPIPIVYCPACGTVPVSEQDLPLELPADLFAPGRPYGLAEHEGFLHAACPRCGGPARRETDTLDCYFDAVWGYLACSTRLDERFAFRRGDFAGWMPVDWFHHGLDSFFYAHLYRFLGRVLFEMGILAQPEPIRRYVGHEAVLSLGRKAGRRHGDGPAPDAVVGRVGADALRLHLLWSANPLKSIEWSDTHLERAQRLLAAVWQLIVPRAEAVARGAALAAGDSPEARAASLLRFLARAVRRVTVFLQDYRYNACIEEIHTLVRRLSDHTAAVDAAGSDGEALSAFAAGVRALIRLLAPFVPHLAEELWERIGGEGVVATAAWPGTADEV